MVFHRPQHAVDLLSRGLLPQQADGLLLDARGEPEHALLERRAALGGGHVQLLEHEVELRGVLDGAEVLRPRAHHLPVELLQVRGAVLLVVERPAALARQHVQRGLAEALGIAPVLAQGDDQRAERAEHDGLGLAGDHGFHGPQLPVQVRLVGFGAERAGASLPGLLRGFNRATGRPAPPPGATDGLRRGAGGCPARGAGRRRRARGRPSSGRRRAGSWGRPSRRGWRGCPRGT